MSRIFSREARPAGGESLSGQDSLPGFPASRILLVEDDEINRQIAVELLELSGVTVVTAANGSEAVGMVTGGGQPFDLVLMDVQMPVMDGYEATKRIRADERFAALPIIAMTAHAMAEERQKTREAGMDDHITKPINIHELIAAMGRHLLPASPGIQPAGDAGNEPTAGAASIPAIPGVDIIGALERLGNDAKLYLWLVENFLESKTETAAEVEHALGCGERELAQRLVHTVRGLAGSIGADGLGAMAAELERSIAKNAPQEQTDTLVKRFAVEMAYLAERLNDALSVLCSEHTDEPALDIDTARIGNVLLRLLRYIEENDAEAEDYLNERRHDLTGVCGKALGRLGMCLAKYDYGASRDIINEIALSMGITMQQWNGEQHD
jgi:two-component system sensor histidine kinase/response regulator